MSWTETQAEALKNVFSALEKSRINWIVLRNHEGLPSTNVSKDVDIGISISDLPLALTVVSQALKKSDFDRASVDYYYGCRSCVFFYCQNSVVLSIKIDLLDAIPFRGAQVFSVTNLSKNSTFNGIVRSPSKTEGAVMLLLKSALIGSPIKAKYIDEINITAQCDPRGFKSELDRYLTKNLANLMWANITRGEISSVKFLMSEIRRSVWLKSLSKHPIRTTINSLLHLLYEVRRRTKRKPASFFAVLGPDGVGKTTFIKSLSRRLADLQVKNADDIALHHFRPHILPNINQLLTGKPEIINSVNIPHSKKPAGCVSSLFRIAYYSIDYILGYWLHLRKRMNAGQTYVFDRYAYDFIVDPHRSRLSLPNWVRRLFLRMIPQPDLVFFLDTSSVEIYGRKQELTLNEIERQLQAYRKLVKSDPARFVKLDASQSADSMVDIALTVICDRLFRKLPS